MWYDNHKDNRVVVCKQCTTFFERAGAMKAVECPKCKFNDKKVKVTGVEKKKFFMKNGKMESITRNEKLNDSDDEGANDSMNRLNDISGR